MPYRLLYITARDGTEATRISRALLEAKLAACVNMFPVQAMYWWQGDIEEARETALLVKTTASLVDKVMLKVRELHSYEVPEIISLPIEKGFPPFLRWIDESTRGERMV